MSGKASRRKGHNFERLVVNRFRKFGFECERNLNQTRASGADIIGTPFTIECKHNKSCTIQAAFRQATAAATPDKPPVVISRDNRSPILVTMSLELFEELLLVKYFSAAKERIIL